MCGGIEYDVGCARLAFYDDALCFSEQHVATLQLHSGFLFCQTH